MLITEIETLLIPHVAVTILRTDAGLEGIGQTSPYHADITVDVLHKMVAPFFLGQDPWNLKQCTDRLLRHQYKFRGTFVLRALCGIDTAIWDLLGKATGQPVYNLIGGKVRDAVQVYTSRMGRDTRPEEEIEIFQDEVERFGFQAAKFKIGDDMGRNAGMDAEIIPGRTRALVPLMRKTFGDGFALIADANGGYSAHKAIEVGRLLEAHGYYFFEEPCVFFKYENTRRVREALDIPIAGGEQDNSLTDFQRMIQERTVDIVQPDIGYIGGLSRAKAVAEMADNAGMPCTPHCANQSLLQVFSLHLVASQTACYQYQEYAAQKDGSWFRDIYHPVPVPVGGVLRVPEGISGWGIELLPAFTTRSERRLSKLSN